jgi:hypothetical protein
MFLSTPRSSRFSLLIISSVTDFQENVENDAVYNFMVLTPHQRISGGKIKLQGVLHSVCVCVSCVRSLTTKTLYTESGWTERGGTEKERKKKITKDITEGGGGGGHVAHVDKKINAYNFVVEKSEGSKKNIWKLDV